MKLIYVYDDKTEVSKGRTRLENIRYFTGEMHPEDLWTEVATYIYEALRFRFSGKHIYSWRWSKVDKNWNRDN
jgi:hypothetical protein